MEESNGSPWTRKVIRFGAFEVDQRTGELRKNGVKLKLQDKPFKILEVLLERPGDVVTREELRRKVWGEDIFGDFERSLNIAIAKLRSTLGDQAENPRFIETLARRGYRFIAPVDATGMARETVFSGELPRRRKLWSTTIAVGVLLSLLAVVLSNVLRQAAKISPRATGPARIESIAILPLEDLSHDPNQEYFADGITAELATQLSKVSALRVISSTSVNRYKGAQPRLPEIARELNVDAVVGGTVLRSGNRLRVTAQLFEAPSSRILWAESYQRELVDLVALQEQVARDIVTHIRVKITESEQARLASARARPVNPEGYELYLRGRYHASKRTRDEIKKSIECFKGAIEKDPGFALAYAGLAESYSHAADWALLSPREAGPRARAAVSKALELDDNLAEAHAVSGLLSTILDWDWATGEREFNRAIELNPGYGPAHHWYTLCLLIQSRSEEALEEAKRAQRLDPVSLAMNTLVSFTFYMARRYDQAIEKAKSTLELDRSYPHPLFVLGLAYEQKGMFQDAIEAFRRLIDLERSPVYVSMLAHAYAVAGRPEQARHVLDELIETSERTYVPAYDVAVVHTGLGEIDRAFKSLQVFSREHSGRLFYLQCDPRLDPLRADARYEYLLRRIGLRGRPR